MLQTFVVLINSIDAVDADDVKTLIEREYEVLNCVEETTDEIVTDRV